MATYHINPAALVNGTGTAASPFNTWASVPTSGVHTYLQMVGTKWAGAFPNLTGGTASNKTVIGAYANADGSDNPALPAPVIDIGDRMLPGTLASPKSGIKFGRVIIKNDRAAVTSDTPMMWLGDNVEFEGTELETNLTALYGENRTGLKIRGLKITAAKAVSAIAAMNALVLAGSVALTGHDIQGLDVLIGDGGPSNAHAIKIGGSVPITDLTLKDIRVRTISGQPTTHVNKAGVFLSNAVGQTILGGTESISTIEISNVDVEDLVDGVFTSSVSNAWIHHNKLNLNNSFGLHSTGTAANPTARNVIEWNICRRNGRNVAPWYGRGIEVSGGGAQHACTGHIIRFNDCSYNYNWGGPGDNGTEGVGIGLDDAASFCFVYGNFCFQNEGQGLQTYGGFAPPADTGGNLITGNWFIENGTAAIWNRRSGGTVRTGGACNVSLSGTKGSRTTFSYNLVIGSFGGVRMAADCSNVSRYGNVFIGQESYAHAAPNMTGIEREIYAPGIPRNIGTLALNGSNSPAPALLSAGSPTCQTIDPMLDTDRYLPLAGSPLLSRAVPWTTVPYRVTNA